MPRLKTEGIDWDALEGQECLPDDMKVYRRHNCFSVHRGYRTFANCVWKSSRYRIDGDGPYAVIHPTWCRCCGHGAIVTLDESAQKAAKHYNSYSAIHRKDGKCSGSCTGEIRIVRLEMGLAASLRLRKRL